MDNFARPAAYVPALAGWIIVLVADIWGFVRLELTASDAVLLLMFSVVAPVLGIVLTSALRNWRASQWTMLAGAVLSLATTLWFQSVLVLDGSKASDAWIGFAALAAYQLAGLAVVAGVALIEPIVVKLKKLLSSSTEQAQQSQRG